VRAVNSGTATLKDATSEAIRDWVTNVETTHYILGSAAGPHPYPEMVREFQSIIGKETRKQCMEKWGGKPDVLLACIGGGSNAIGLFHEFVEDADVRLIGTSPTMPATLPQSLRVLSLLHSHVASPEEVLRPAAAMLSNQVFFILVLFVFLFRSPCTSRGVDAM
jgi:hypothetical protein